MKLNIDTILSTFLTGYIKCNTKTHVLVSRLSQTVFFFFYLSVGIYRIILVTGKGVTLKQISYNFFFISKLY